MSKWLNKKFLLKENKDKKKPCYACGFCPYGMLVEEFPLKKKSKYRCDCFGHTCPVYYLAEDVAE